MGLRRHGLTRWAGVLMLLAGLGMTVVDWLMRREADAFYRERERHS